MDNTLINVDDFMKSFVNMFLSVSFLVRNLTTALTHIESNHFILSNAEILSVILRSNMMLDRVVSKNMGEIIEQVGVTKEELIDRCNAHLLTLPQNAEKILHYSPDLEQTLVQLKEYFNIGDELVGILRDKFSSPVSTPKSKEKENPEFNTELSEEVKKLAEDFIRQLNDKGQDENKRN